MKASSCDTLLLLVVLLIILPFLTYSTTLLETIETTNTFIVTPMDSISNYTINSFCTMANYSTMFEISKISLFQVNNSISTLNATDGVVVVQNDNTTAILLDEYYAIVLPTGIRINITQEVFDYISLNTSTIPENINNTYDGIFSYDVVDFESIDSYAEQMHYNLTRFLIRYNCRDFYPYHSCDPCSNAYRSWSCGVLFPKFNSIQSVTSMCKQVCFNVIQKCPVELQVCNIIQ
jgi:hypothetical protein